MKKPEIILVDDTFWKSMGRDVVSCISLVIGIHVSVLLDSIVWQIAILILMLLLAVSWANRPSLKERMTPNQARKYLDRKYPSVNKTGSR